jgi:hypothetical protein
MNHDSAHGDRLTNSPDWRARALEAEAEVARLRAELAALRRRLRRRWTKAATRRWFEAGIAEARKRDRERHRGHDVKVPLTIVAKVEAEGVYMGKQLAAEVARLAHADVRTAYRALDRWRKFKTSGIVFLVELDEQGRLVVTTC